MNTVMMSGGDLGGQELAWETTGTLPAPDSRDYMDLNGQRYVRVSFIQAVFFGPAT